jgi:hypothetical protein
MFWSVKRTKLLVLYWSWSNTWGMIVDDNHFHSIDRIDDTVHISIKSICVYENLLINWKQSLTCEKCTWGERFDTKHDWETLVPNTCFSETTGHSNIHFIAFQKAYFRALAGLSSHKVLIFAQSKAPKISSDSIHFDAQSTNQCNQKIFSVPWSWAWVNNQVRYFGWLSQCRAIKIFCKWTMSNGDVCHERRRIFVEM